MLRRSRSRVASRTASVSSSSRIPAFSANRDRRLKLGLHWPHAVPRHRRRLARLEWPDLRRPAARHLRTPQARAALANAPFAAEPPRRAERLAETSEARALLLDGARLPLGELRDARRGARCASAKGGALTAGGAPRGGAARRLRVARRAASSRAARSDAPAPRRRSRGARGPRRARRRHRRRARAATATCADAASPALAARAPRGARARPAARRQRIDGLLSDRDVAAALSDSFVTQRGDRYVLPVRSDAARARAGHRARRLGHGHDALRRARGGGRAQQPPEAGGARDRARDAARAARRSPSAPRPPRPRWSADLDDPRRASISPSRARRFAEELDASEPDARRRRALRAPPAPPPVAPVGRRGAERSAPRRRLPRAGDLGSERRRQDGGDEVARRSPR